MTTRARSPQVRSRAKAWLQAAALAPLLAPLGVAPANARGAWCGASCNTWILPLAAVALSACLILAGLYYLAVGLAPSLRSWADARRGRAKNVTVGAALAALGLAGLALIAFA